VSDQADNHTTLKLFLSSSVDDSRFLELFYQKDPGIICKNRTGLGNLDVINILRGRGVFPVMPADAGIQVAGLNFSGFLLPAFAGTGLAGMTDLSPENTPTPEIL
jgi:hypothetical protein